jgi:hypothetical protein
VIIKESFISAVRSEERKETAELGDQFESTDSDSVCVVFVFWKQAVPHRRRGWAGR